MNETIQEHNKNITVDINDIPEEEFSYEGFEVVRGEFFAHLFEPSVSFNKEKISVNTACIRKLPETEYVQILVNTSQKMLAIKPCNETDRDSFKWNTGEAGKRKPKEITCHIFYAKVMELMKWDPTYRHKILGKLIRTGTDKIFVFDLSSAETYAPRTKDGINKSVPLYPEAWKTQFGVPVYDHDNTMKISIFDDRAIIKLTKEDENQPTPEIRSTDDNRGCIGNELGHTERQDTNTQEITSQNEGSSVYTDLSQS